MYSMSSAGMGERVSCGLVARSQDEKGAGTSVPPRETDDNFTEPLFLDSQGERRTNSLVQKCKKSFQVVVKFYILRKTFPPYSVSIMEASSERALRSRFTLRYGKRSRCANQLPIHSPAKV